MTKGIDENAAELGKRKRAYALPNTSFDKHIFFGVSTETKTKPTGVQLTF